MGLHLGLRENAWDAVPSPAKSLRFLALPPDSKSILYTVFPENTRISIENKVGQITLVFSFRRPRSDPRYAGLPRRLRHRLGDRRADALVKRLGDDVIRAQLVFGHKARNRVARRNLHRLVDVLGAAVERAAENAGERQHVVDLVFVVASAAADNRRARRQRLVRVDFRNGVRHREHARARVHARDHLARHHARRAHADKHVRPAHRVGQRAGDAARVRPAAHLLVRRVQPLHALAENAEPIHHDQILHAEVHQVLADGHARAARAVDDHLRRLHRLADDLQRVEQRRRNDDGRSVLIVMENGNVADFLQPALDLKSSAARRCLPD